MVTNSALRGVLLAALTVASCSFFVSGAAATPALDQAFGDGGFVTPTVFPHRKKFQTARAVALQSDGKTVVPMTLPFAHGQRARRPVIRLNTDGSRDRTYGSKGVAWVRAGGAPFITLRGAKTYADDSTLIWGEYSFSAQGEADGFFVARLSAQGVQDKKFGDRGARRFSLDIPGNDTDLVDVSPAADGGVIVAYNTYSLSRARDTLRIARLSPDGSIVRSFGTNGTKSVAIDTRLDLGGFSVSRDSAYLLLHKNSDCFVRRFDLAGGGAQDLTYGVGGDARISGVESAAQESYCIGMSSSESGAVVVHGEYFVEGARHSGFVSRLQPDGSPDASFGSSGLATVESLENAYRSAALPDRGVILGGACKSKTRNGCVAVLDQSGVSVASFGRAGVLDVGKWVGPVQLTASGNAAAVLLLDEDTRSYAQTRIVKLSL
ncbi:MAG: hypothetical protein JHD02_11265 [Thermoleophilaceae bacterium]|nr:hypothetical protein [Thermoleophilaceae bacterium]